MCSWGSERAEEDMLEVAGKLEEHLDQLRADPLVRGGRPWTG